MGKITGNEPANPQWDMTFDQNPGSDLFSAGTSTGITIKQTMAKDILCSLLSNNSVTHAQSLNRTDIVDLALRSVGIAEILIEALNSKEKE